MASQETTRLTMAQALVKFLANQYIELDGQKYKFIQGVFGIFGHGNVTGIGIALEEYSDLLPYYRVQNEQGGALVCGGCGQTLK